jgi:very-short-patch-repair endonuclease
VRELLAAAAENHGVLTGADLEQAGVTDWTKRRLLADGVVVRVVPGIFRLGGAPRTHQQTLALALAEHGPSGHVGLRSAAALWGVPGYPHLDRPDVLVAEERERRSRLSRLHTTSLLLPAHRSVRAGFPVTSPARTLFDLAAVEPLRRVERAVDHLLVRELVTTAKLDAVLSALGGRGRAGTVAFRQILEDRGAGYVAPASELERSARSVFREAGLPEPEFEVDLGDGAWIARVDCLWRSAKLVVELDGRRYHDGRSALDDDRRRDNRLMAAGWRVLRFTWDDLQRRPAEVVATVRAALEISS